MWLAPDAGTAAGVSTPSSDCAAGRAVLVDRARAARRAIQDARRATATRAASRPRTEQRARRELARYATAGAELAPADRLAARVAQGWLDTARSYLIFGSRELAEAEMVAYRYLRALPDRDCPRNAPRRIRRRHNACLRRWHTTHGPAIAELVARVHATDPARDGPGLAAVNRAERVSHR